ncbi:MAG: hypothetical protein WCJ41_20750 [Aestuariivirga sp.]|uniref:hypothetical protein n=1 Tax=Aestuariivirga sp. TaxID=2650926 RepID=UPI00301B41FB
MKLLKRSPILSCGASASALVLASNGVATEIIISPAPPVSTLQLGTGDVGTVQEGGVKDVTFGYGIHHGKLAIRWMSG